MYVTPKKDGVTIKVRVTPNASKNSLTEGPGRLEIKLNAPPVDGKANQALIKLLGKAIGVPPTCISIVQGASSREKVLFIPGVEENYVRDKIKSQL